MEPYLIEIENPETHDIIIVDMEGPYHKENERLGEHIYGATLIINGTPYHFEKYVPEQNELTKFEYENDGRPSFSEGKFLYRLVPFVE
ncbi:MAG: hypothetical protein ABIL22_09490 [candidate division WOR-3 bacterium]